MTQTRLTSTYDLFINRLVVLGSRVVSDFATNNNNNNNNIQMHKILKFSSTSFHIFKSLHDSHLINAVSYSSFKFQFN